MYFSSPAFGIVHNRKKAHVFVQGSQQCLFTESEFIVFLHLALFRAVMFCTIVPEVIK